MNEKVEIFSRGPLDNRASTHRLIKASMFDPFTEMHLRTCMEHASLRTFSTLDDRFDLASGTLCVSPTDFLPVDSFCLQAAWISVISPFL
jgi:hypothetical protein